MVLQTDEFNHKMKYAFMNDDPEGVLSSVYDNELPHPYFNPKDIAFSHLRSYNHWHWLEREKSNRTIIFQDLEYLLPYENNDQVIKEKVVQSPFSKNFTTLSNKPPCIEGDYLIKSSISKNDHLWPCENVFSSWHLINTNMANKDVVLEQNTQRPYFANCLFGNVKPMRQCFFDLLFDNNLLESNLINLFEVYKSPFIDKGTSQIDNFFTNINHTYYTNTAINELDGVPTFTSHYVSKHIEDNTWISIVSETLEDDSIFFPTEKTGKPMLCAKPFIALSGKYFLKNLRDIGFKTFHPIIDESYDLIDDKVERVKSAFNSFLNLSKQDPLIIRKQLQEVLDHNEKCMRDKLWLSRNARAMLDPLTTTVQSVIINDDYKQI